MNQPRHDLYTGVHKGLRRRIFESIGLLESCDCAVAAERERAFNHARLTVEFLDDHAQHEDRFLQPMLVSANPSLAQRVAAAHQRVEQSGAAVSKLVETLASCDQETALSRGPELCHAFNVLASQHLEHMNEEETLVQAALWQAYTDQELLATHSELLAAIPPDRYAEWLRLMLPALNAQERIGMMAGMKAGAPADAFQRVMGLGREVVGEPWKTVEAAMAAF